MAKYNNVKTFIDGITFDSKREAFYYQYYRNLEKDGKIQDLLRQVPFHVVVNDKKICKYFADFTYNDEFGYHVIDVKSKITRVDKVFRLKKKLVEALYNIEIEIVE